MQAEAELSVVSLVPARVFESRAAVTVDGRFAMWVVLVRVSLLRCRCWGVVGCRRLGWGRWWRM